MLEMILTKSQAMHFAEEYNKYLMIELAWKHLTVWDCSVISVRKFQDCSILCVDRHGEESYISLNEFKAAYGID